MTLQEQIAGLQARVEEITEEWNLAQLNRDPYKIKDAEERLVNAQTELNLLLMRRPV